MTHDRRPKSGMNHSVGLRSLWMVALVVMVQLRAIPRAVEALSAQVLSDEQQLLDALSNQSCTRIVLGSSIKLAANHPSSIPITRNVTITALSPSAVLDFAWAEGLVSLCGSCTLTLANLTIANERRGTGPGLDSVAGRPGSRVATDSIVRLRLACSPAPVALAALMATPRSSAFPAAGGPQDASIQDVTLDGKAWPGSLVYRDISLDMPPARQEGENVHGGFALSCHNDTRLCQRITSSECLARKSPDACVDDLIDEVSSGATAGAGGQQAQQPSAGILAAIVVPVVLAVVVLVVLGAALVRQRRQVQGSKHLPGDRDAGDCEEGRAKSVYTLSPVGAHKGWELHSRLTSPLVQGDVQDDTIHFAELLGAGSFGRVFKGRWAGRCVAIKVIEHSSSTLAAVENEVRLMMSFNHPHLVRALHCVTLVCPHMTPTSPCARPSSNCSSSHEPGSGNNVSKAAAQDGLQTMLSHDSDQQQPERQQSDVFNSTNGSAYGLSSGHPGSSKGTWGGCSTRSDVGDRRAETRLVLEFCDCGTLRGYVAQFWRPEEQQQQEQPAEQDGGSSRAVGSPQELQLLVLLHGAAAGLEVLHSSNVVHSDLNAQNVLVSSSAAAPFGAMAKISDLGLARVMGENRTHRTTNTLGTLNHLAPEQLRSGKTSPAGDVYAFGIMLYELYTGSAAFRKLHNVGQFYETVVLHNLRPLVPQSMPADLRLLMEHCWAAEPQDRPTAARVVECLRMMIQERAMPCPGICSSSSNVQPLPSCPQEPQQQLQLGRGCHDPGDDRPSSDAASAAGRSSSLWRSFAGARPDGTAGSRSPPKNSWRFGSPTSNSGSSLAQPSQESGLMSGEGFSTLDYQPFTGGLIKHRTFDTAYDPAAAGSCDNSLDSCALPAAAQGGVTGGSAAPWGLPAEQQQLAGVAVGAQQQQQRAELLDQQWQQQFGAGPRDLDEASARSWLQSVQGRSARLFSDGNNVSKLSNIWFV